MNIRRVVPNVASERMAESRAFYTQFMGMTVAMDMGWIMTLVSPDNPTAQLTVLQSGGGSAVHPDVSIEVEDVDALHQKAVARGEPIVYPLTDEPWGVRRFFVRDPNGVVINVMSHRA
ncbi:MAG: glyoxalase [Planctomycetes bacterium]|nr:glyoxalase [Planctomycetota bacterium]